MLHPSWDLERGGGKNGLKWWTWRLLTGEGPILVVHSVKSQKKSNVRKTAVPLCFTDECEGWSRASAAAWETQRWVQRLLKQDVIKGEQRSITHHREPSPRNIDESCWSERPSRWVSYQKVVSHKWQFDCINLTGERNVAPVIAGVSSGAGGVFIMKGRDTPERN